MATNTYNPKDYNPNSYFFVDYSALATASTTPEIVISDSFGPVPSGDGTTYSTTQYCTTSFVRATDSTTPVKVFAICEGDILILPCYRLNTTTNANELVSDKVNLILKPKDCYAPLKIKYFVYRGVNKSDLIYTTAPTPTQDSVISIVPNDSNTVQPDLVKIINNSSWSDGSPIPALQVGYKESTDSSYLAGLIESFFESFNYQLPHCYEGDFLGYFTNAIGLDVVLDYGNCIQDYQNKLFQFDLNYAQQDSYVLDSLKITSSTATKIKRYRENVLQFMDAAAFWGSHINCGKISYKNASGTKSKLQSASEISSTILSKYQTASNVYIYVTEDNGRSYGYYDTGTTRSVYFDLETISDNTDLYAFGTSSWPIVIKKYNITVDDGIFGYLQYNIATDILNQEERAVIVDMFDPGSDSSSYPKKISPASTGIDNTIVTIGINSNGTNSCAKFVMIAANLVQQSPMQNYFNCLFPANIISSTYLSTDTSSYCLYDRNRMVNLYPLFNIGAKMYNKVIIDTQKTTKRYLFMSVIKENTKQTGTLACKTYQQLNVLNRAFAHDSVTSATEYAENVYGSSDFSVYKGEFTDSELTGTSTVKSLALINTTDLALKKSFFHLGITDTEYKQLFPDATATISKDADNVFFKLVESFSSPVQNSDYRKFQLGLSYEDSNGTLTTYFPAAGSEIYVYTMDGFYFFSQAYGVSQDYCDQFASVSVNFRPLVVETLDPNSPLKDVSTDTLLTSSPATKYNGEFGFDWLRLGDNSIGRYEELSYAQTLINGYRPNLDYNDINNNSQISYTNADLDTVETYDDPTIGVRGTTRGWQGIYDSVDSKDRTKNIYGINSYKALLREYNAIPTMVTNSIPYVLTAISGFDSANVVFSKTYSQYYIPYINLFSQNDSVRIWTDNDTSNTNADTSPIPDPAPAYQANLRLVIHKQTAADSFTFSFTQDSSNSFTISNLVITDNSTLNTVYGTVTIQCDKRFDTDKTIYVWATDNSSNKRLAGMIIARANNIDHWKNLNIVYVPVSSLEIVQQPPSIGIVSRKYKQDLQKCLYQNFIIPNFIDYSKSTLNDKDGNTTLSTVTYDYFKLDSDPNFNIGGSFVNAAGKLLPDGKITYNGHNDVTFFHVLKETFLSRPENRSKYGAFYLAFFFGADSSDISGAAQTEFAGYKNSAFFNANVVGSIPGTTIGHEVLHGLGLKHTHRDLTTSNDRLNLIPEQKFIYFHEPLIKYKVTGNFMSYNTIQSNETFTWKWQWDILDEKFKSL